MDPDPQHDLDPPTRFVGTSYLFYLIWHHRYGHPLPMPESLHPACYLAAYFLRFPEVCVSSTVSPYPSPLLLSVLSCSHRSQVPLPLHLSHHSYILSQALFQASASLRLIICVRYR
jgi:hypothetical protein